MAYARKILQDSELQAWQKQGISTTDLWTYWSLKECAYKIESRMGLPRALNPRRYMVTQKDNDIWQVDSPKQSFSGLRDFHNEYLICVAATGSEILEHTHWLLTELSSASYDSQSAETRQHVCNNFPDMSFHHSLKGPNFVSLSHDGLLGGFALYLPTV